MEDDPTCIQELHLSNILGHLFYVILFYYFIFFTFFSIWYGEEAQCNPTTWLQSNATVCLWFL